jgi:glycosyltransferase involved in cell wall biosynthesis
MNIFINAVALKVAGGKSILSNFLSAISKESYGHTYHVFLPRDPVYQQYENIPHLKLNPVNPLFNKFYFRYFIDHHYLRVKLKEIKPDVLFSMGNIALPVTTVPQVLLFQMAHVLYPESDYWNRVGMQKKYLDIVSNQITRKFKFAAVIAAQTEVARKRLHKHYGLDKVVVIPNAVSLNSSKLDSANDIPGHFSGLEQQLKGSFSFLCLSRYYGHKNLEILLDVAERIKQSGRNYKILITIERNQGKGAAWVLDQIVSRNVEDVIINLGNVQMENVSYLYRITNGMLLPTLLESFSGTYIESAFFKRPVFTSNYDFARDILGENAVYFDPLNADDIVKSLDKIKDSTFVEGITARAFEKINTYPTWTQVAHSYIQLLEETSKFNYVQ